MRVSAIRALASLKDASATAALLERGAMLLAATAVAKNRFSAGAHPTAVNELLEIATALGRLRQDSNDERVVNWLRNLRPVTGPGAPEVEVALARIQPAAYLAQFGSGKPGRQMAQGCNSDRLARGCEHRRRAWAKSQPCLIRPMNNKRLRSQAEDILRSNARLPKLRHHINTLVAVHSEYAIPDVLRAYAAFKPKDLDEVLRKHLKESDVVVRGTAAELLGELPA